MASLISAFQKRNALLDIERSRQLRMMKYVGAGVLAVLGVLFICVDFCTVSIDTMDSL